MIIFLLNLVCIYITICWILLSRFVTSTLTMSVLGSIICVIEFLKNGCYVYSLMDRVFAKGPGDMGSIPGRVIPKTRKMVLDTALLNTQQYKVSIYASKVKWSNTEKGVPTSTTSQCSSYWKGSLLVALHYGRQLYLLTFLFKNGCFKMSISWLGLFVRYDEPATVNLNVGSVGLGIFTNSDCTVSTMCSVSTAFSISLDSWNFGIPLKLLIWGM